jgi:hypothetical protein
MKNKNLKILIYATEVVISLVIGYCLYEFIFSLSPKWANNFFTYLAVIVGTVSLFTWFNKKIGIE